MDRIDRETEQFLQAQPPRLAPVVRGIEGGITALFVIVAAIVVFAALVRFYQISIQQR